MSPIVYLVTGCSSGFGASYVDHILKRSDKVIATARNASRIKNFEEKGAATLELDVTWPQDKIDAALKQAINLYGHIDVLINNAGYVLVGFLEETTSEQWQSNFDTNVFGAVKVTKAILPHFRARKTGTIVFTGSLASYGGSAGCSSYCATKGSVSLIAESVAMETAGLGIQTLCFEPGYFRTELLSGRNLAKTSDQSTTDYGTAAKDTKDVFSATGGNQAGDVKKGIAKMLNLVKAARAGQKLPVRIPVGDDSVEYARVRIQKLISDLQAHEKLLTGTNVDGVATPPVEMLGMYL